MSEILYATITQIPDNGSIASIPQINKDGNYYFSHRHDKFLMTLNSGQIFTANGPILSNMEAKVKIQYQNTNFNN